MFYKGERIAVFIDGANFFSAAKALNFEIDYRLLREEFMRRGKLVRMSYHIALLENDEFTTLRPLVDWLCYNGYSVASKTAREYTDPQGRRKVKSNVAIDIAVASLELSPHVDHIVLFSGDGDLRPLVEAIKRTGVRVSIVSTIRSQPSMISDELRRTADNFIELDQLKAVISRPARQQTAAEHDETESDLPEVAAAS